MKKEEVTIGGFYFAKVSGKRVQVRIDSEAMEGRGGWNATNMTTNKKVYVATARRLSPTKRMIVGSKVKAIPATNTKVTTDGNVTVVECEPATVEIIGGAPAPVCVPKKLIKKKDAAAAGTGGVELWHRTPEKKLSCVTAAIKVLTEATEPLNAQQIIEAMVAKGYWTSPGGKTPHATLYSAILRDLARGDDSRFIKSERGRFAAKVVPDENR